METFCPPGFFGGQKVTGTPSFTLSFPNLPGGQVSGWGSQIPREQYQQSVQLVEPDGSVYNGAEAVFRTLAFAPRKRWTLWLYQRVPGVGPVTEWFYRFVARHRTAFSFLTRLFWGKHVEVPTHFLTRWVFLRLLGLSLPHRVRFVVDASGRIDRQQRHRTGRALHGRGQYRLAGTQRLGCVLVVADVVLVQRERRVSAFPMRRWRCIVGTGDSRDRDRSCPRAAVALLSFSDGDL